MGFRLPAKLYLDAGYKNVQTDRRISNVSFPRYALPYNTDNIYSTNLKWIGLDFMSARIGYERLSRGADYRFNPESAGELNRRFAYAAQDRDIFKAGVDPFPIDNLNIGLEYNYKQVNYNDTRYGLKDDTRNAFNLNVDYAFKDCTVTSIMKRSLQTRVNLQIRKLQGIQWHHGM